MKDLITPGEGGEVGALLRAAGGVEGPLGMASGWPLPLRTLVGVMLGTPQPMFVAWGDGQHLLYNDGMASLLGERHPAALGRPLAEAWPDLSRALQPSAQQAGSGCAGALHDLVLTSPLDGRAEPRRVSLSCSPVRDAAGVPCGIFCTVTDLTAAQRALDAEQRKDAFLATLAHELRNPLAPIRTAAHALGEPGLAPDDLAWCREVITRQAHHMALLLDDLLDVSRITSGRLELRRERADLHEIVQSAVETVQPLLDARRHELVVRLPTGRIELDVDLLRLAQVLSNLLTNAAKYTHPGGRIVLSASAGDAGVRFSVQDNGVGLDAPSLARAFEMFSQVRSAVDRTEGGLGIGLALSKGLVALHGGTLTGASAGLGQGATFTVRLPPACLVAQRREAPRPSVPEALPIRSPLRILVADDNLDAAESLALLLRFEGHEVRLAADGPAALDGITQWRPQVAILDIGMPGLNGYEVARRIRLQAWGREVFLLAVTGWGQDDDRHQAASAGFDQHMVKPVDPPALIQVIGRWATGADGTNVPPVSGTPVV